MILSFQSADKNFMAWTYKTSFETSEGYSNAAGGDVNLDGEQSWSIGRNNVHLTIDGSPPNGTQCIKFTYDDVNSTAKCERSITAKAAGTFYFSVKQDGGSDAFYLYLYKDAVAVCYLKVSGGNFYARHQGDWVDTGLDLTSDTWDRIGFKFDSATDKFYLNLNNGSWQGPYDFENNVDDINKIVLVASTGGVGHIAYFDFVDTEYAPAPPTSPDFTDKDNYSGYLAFIQQYMRHKINDTTPWKNPDGTLF